MKYKMLAAVTMIVLIGVIAFAIPTASSIALSAEPKPTSLDTQTTQKAIEQAILEAVAVNKNYLQGDMVSNLQVSNLEISSDQQWAIAWVVYYDSQIDAVIPTEPALAVAHYEGNEWKVYLPTDPSWQVAIQKLPTDLLSADEKNMWLAMNQGTVESIPTQTGYYLPWHGGDTAYLSRSVGHDADYNTSHYAFDFFLPGNTVCPGGGMESSGGATGLNFNLYASKAATVWGWEDSVEDCDHSKVNFIVLQNVDDPTIFQLYMHLSQGSIPPALKTIGAPVARGQFIAVADNTGNSTGSHLHFQVEHQPNWPPENPYWNTSLPMTFVDVPINGGRPHVDPPDRPYCHTEDVCDIFRIDYVSGNYYMGDDTPPTGALNGLSDGQIVVSPTITLSGWGSDDGSGLDYGQLIANFDGSWHDLGSRFNPAFSYQWDLCNPSLSVSNGPISVALLLYDKAGNPAPRVGLINVIKDCSCPIPPPSCIPDENQVTLFEDPFFRGGCVKFNIGDYPTGQSLDPLGDDDADSIMVGDQVIATLYSEGNYTGHSQVVGENTAYMNYSWVPSSSLSSMKVTSIGNLPEAPTTISPVDSDVFRLGDVIPFSLRNGGGASEYRFELYLDSNLLKTYPWQVEPVLNVDSLAEGSYSWRVQGKNTTGTSPWSQKSEFTIESPILYPPEETVPYSDTMENTQSKWIREGLWSYINNPVTAHSGAYSWWFQNIYGNYDMGEPTSGSLTSPPISISDAGYFLNFYYRYQTETTGATWDQRWVQISVGDGPFINVMQMVDDPQIPETTSWMRNKPIDLSIYSGQIIRVRFQFSTLDAAANNFSGWGIDDFSISSNQQPNCGENRQDDTPVNAFLITYDPTLSIPGEICPNGDYDYYKFFGNAGDRIVADVDAMINGSLLDSYMYLLAPDGKTVLAENDDEVYAELRDPLLSYTLPEAGVYYIKLKAWKHPLVGGKDYSYSIRLYEDKNAPIANILWPQSNVYLPDSEMNLTVNATDLSRGINRVEFYWHPANWISSSWQLVGTDRDGSDGWSTVFSPAGQPEGKDAAVFVQAFDNAGSWAGSASWYLGIDKTPPTTKMDSLPATQPSNAFLLTWTGTDNLSGLDHFEIQEQVDNGAWVPLPYVNGSIFQYWIIGNPRSTYSYRMRGVDRSGNTETYPLSPEGTTSIPDSDVICYSLDSYDVSGNDNNPGNASMIYANGASQFHNFCNPLAPDYQNDEDWVKLEVADGEHLLIQSIPKSLPTSTVISLFAQDGTTLIAETTPSQFGVSTNLVWTSDRSELVYIRFHHLDGRVIGSDVGSTITVKTGLWTFLPSVRR